MAKRLSLVCNAAIAVLCAFAWCQMAFGWGSDSGPLAAFGLSSLKYFTTLSNIFSAAVSAIFAVRAARGAGVPDWLHCLRLVATTSVTLTLLTVELFLAPALYGYASMHVGANLWFHLVLPLLAIVSFCAFEADRPIPMRWTFVALAPMLLYGTCYYANLLVNGMGRASLVFAAMALATWGIAAVLRAVNQRARRSTSGW